MAVKGYFSQSSISWRHFTQNLRTRLSLQKIIRENRVSPRMVRNMLPEKTSTKTGAKTSARIAKFFVISI